MKTKKLFAIMLGLVLFAIAVFVAPITKSDNSKFYCNTYYNGTGGNTNLEKVTISYDNHTMSETYINKLLPPYKNLTQANSCAPMAGSIVVGYYDVFLPNLIPNFEAGFTYNGVFRYAPQNSAVINMKEQLYALMGTNSIQPGTSVNQFKTGLTSYVESKGYNINYASCGTTFNYSIATNHFLQQTPIIMFVNSYEYYDLAGINTTSTEITMLKKQENVGHAVAAFGFREYNFYKNNKLFRTDKYMIVCFGDGSQGLLSINNLNTIDEAYAITIY